MSDKTDTPRTDAALASASSRLYFNSQAGRIEAPDAARFKLENLARTLERESAARSTLLHDVRQVVAEQAEDAGLWFDAKTAPEAYLQAALRRLHATIEDDKDAIALLSSVP